MSSGPYTRLVSSVLFPLHERLKGHSSVARRQDLENSQWWDTPRLQALQLDRLRRFLIDVETRVPYYRDLFARLGFSPRNVQDPADLQVLPLLTKNVIRENSSQLKADGAPWLKRYNTGGSGGEPLIFYIGKERVSHDVAAKWRATRWWGVDIGDPEVVIWGSPIELGAQDRVRVLRDRLLRTHLLSAFEMSESKLNEFVMAIRTIRPRMLFGYPSAISHIAAHASRRGQRLDRLGLKVVFVTSERLYEHQQEQIESTFGAPVANGYGGRDAGFIAHQCPHGGMHISSEDIVVETVDPAGRTLPPGQSGEIVVTHLATGDFPFVRYRTGDLGILDDTPCACGRGLPLLKEIQGRATDFVVARDGTIMHGLALIYILRDLPELASFKIIQESRERVRVLVVPRYNLSKATEHAIKHGFQERLGAGVTVLVESVSQIAPERSGKFRYVISKVDSEQVLN